jgi:hypothetical protein
MTWTQQQDEGLIGSVTWLLVKSGEDLFEEFIKSLDDCKFEIKRDMYRNGRMVVEMQQKPRDKEWKPSGLAVTKAKYWVYMFSADAFSVIEVARLKKYLEINNNIPMKTFAPYSANPTKGYLLMEEDVIKLMSSELYDTKGKK